MIYIRKKIALGILISVTIICFVIAGIAFFLSVTEGPYTYQGSVTDEEPVDFIDVGRLSAGDQITYSYEATSPTFFGASNISRTNLLLLEKWRIDTPESPKIKWDDKSVGTLTPTDRTIPVTVEGSYIFTIGKQNQTSSFELTYKITRYPYRVFADEFFWSGISFFFGSIITVMIKEEG